MAMYSNIETDYRKDNVTITLRYTDHKAARESLFEKHPELKVQFANNITALVLFFRDRQYWPVSEGFPIQEGAVAQRATSGTRYQAFPAMCQPTI